MAFLIQPLHLWFLWFFACGIHVLSLARFLALNPSRGNILTFEGPLQLLFGSPPALRFLRPLPRLLFQRLPLHPVRFHHVLGGAPEKRSRKEQYARRNDSQCE